jgi:hypothetical protein
MIEKADTKAYAGAAGRARAMAFLTLHTFSPLIRGRLRARGIALIVFMLVSAGVAFAPGRSRAADIYRYTDKHGVVHVVQDLEQVPPQYRGKAVKVDGKVTVIKTEGGKESGGGQDLIKLPESLERFFGADHNEPAPSASRAWIVISELWRSHLAISVFFTALFFCILVTGQVLARDVVKSSKRLGYRALLAASFLAFVLLLWIGPAARQTGRFFQGCRERSELGLKLPDLNSEQRDRLLRFHDLFSRWSDRMEGTEEQSGS